MLPTAIDLVTVDNICAPTHCHTNPNDFKRKVSHPEVIPVKIRCCLGKRRAASPRQEHGNE
jgi:hypothetical protein